MSAETQIPATLVAGDGWSWSDPAAFAAHPPPDWALHYVLRPVAGGAAITVVALWSGETYRLTRTAAETAGTAPGEYRWDALAFHDASGDRVHLGSGRVTVLPDPAQAGGDLRSAAERILAAIEATIEGRAARDAESYSIEGRSIARTPLADLIRLRALYRREVEAERAPGASPIRYRRVAL